jgi:nucleotide-binding universal stress UspA family protein
LSSYFRLYEGCLDAADPKALLKGTAMVEIRSVLCPVDFSDFSRRALDHAIAVAGWYGARLTILYVHHVEISSIAQFTGLGTGSPEPPALLSAADREQLRQQLKGMVRAEALKRIPVEFAVAEGGVADEILAAVESADMLVMGTHGRSGFDRLVFGSVTERVLRKAKCPMLTIPRTSPVATAVPALFHQILVAVDFSDASTLALDYALSLAEEADAHVTVFHVTEIPLELERWANEDEEGKKYVEQWKAYALARLRPVVPDAVRVYCHVKERVDTGQPYQAILRAAADEHAGLIVIGRHGHGVVEETFVGSTAQHIVREAACPVLAVRKR